MNGNANDYWTYNYNFPEHFEIGDNLLKAIQEINSNEVFTSEEKLTCIKSLMTITPK